MVKHGLTGTLYVSSDVVSPSKNRRSADPTDIKSTTGRELRSAGVLHTGASVPGW